MSKIALVTGGTSGIGRKRPCTWRKRLHGV